MLRPKQQQQQQTCSRYTCVLCFVVDSVLAEQTLSILVVKPELTEKKYDVKNKLDQLTMVTSMKPQTILVILMKLLTELNLSTVSATPEDRVAMVQQVQLELMSMQPSGIHIAYLKALVLEQIMVCF